MKRIEYETYQITELAARFGVTVRQWASWTDRGLVPAPSFVHDGRARWLREAIDTWERSGGDLFASEQAAFEHEARLDYQFTDNITEN